MYYTTNKRVHRRKKRAIALAKRVYAYAVLSIITKSHSRKMKHKTTWPNLGAWNVTFLLNLCVLVLLWILINDTIKDSLESAIIKMKYMKLLYE